MVAEEVEEAVMVLLEEMAVEVVMVEKGELAGMQRLEMLEK